MNKLLAALLLIIWQPFHYIKSHSQEYWQQELHYKINVALNDKLHTLNGDLQLEYINHSPDTLHFIWFHVWPNAYKNDKTAYSDQALQNGNTDFYFSDQDEKGYINRLDFKVNDVTAETEDHPQHIDIIRLRLPAPLAPQQKIIITTPFHVRLPFNFSRGGHDGEAYQVTQWYPKPAVYDRDGWHPMPYLDQGEFYSEFASFDVTITLPENYAVAATGELQSADEKIWLKARKNFNWEPEKKKVKRGSTTKTVVQKFPASSSNIKTLRYKQDRIHDFAWFADKRFIVDHDTCALASGKVIDVYSYYTATQQPYWKNTTRFIKDAVRTRSAWIGEYPYSSLSVVQGPESFGGGMEYPTITVISPMNDENMLDFVISHEIGHNWFYGILGSNERDHPWMDEGLNTYYDNRYSQWRHGDKGEIKIGSSRISLKNAERILFESKAVINKDQPINTASEYFTDYNYNLVAYYKTGAWLEYLESLIGRETFDKAMQEYYRQWQFRHPQPADFKRVMEQISGRNLDSAFALLDRKGKLPGQEIKGTKAGFIFNLASHARYINNPVKNYLVFGPSIGYNKYDQLMIGGLISNYKLPPNRFRFFLAPMYATGSKNLAGMGRADLAFYPAKSFQKINLGMGIASFGINDFKDQEGNKVTASVLKFVPSLKLVLKEKDPRSTRLRFVQFKSYIIGEDAFQFYRDTVVSPANDTSIYTRARTIGEDRVFNQLRFVSENNRALYPWRGELKIEQGKGFYRAAFTGNYFFNYANGGGLTARFFAGKFIYSGEKTIRKQFETDRYHLNMTGPNGYEDYTYSDYFIGRNEFEGMTSQQIMVRDGGFKVRTELLADKVGKTDDWLVALNLSTTIPPNTNPLNVLPVKIPLKIFADIGTYREAWDRDATGDRFLFNAGLQLPLFKETINIYLPLVYSKVYKDYIKSTLEKKNRFLKTISFSIDIANFNLRKFNRQLAE